MQANIALNTSNKKSNPAHSIVSAEIGREAYLTKVVANGHAFISDEPESKGGGNTGPTPSDLLLSSLAACITITLRMYVDRKGWPMDGVRVELESSRVKAAEWTADPLPEGFKGLVDVIDTKVTIFGDDLTEEQLKRIEIIAHKCPMHRMITGQTRVPMQLVHASSS